jgi:hypothetical protein
MALYARMQKWLLSLLLLSFLLKLLWRELPPVNRETAT